MRFSVRTSDMPICKAEAMVEWLRASKARKRHRSLEQIQADIERERDSGTYLAGEVVRFASPGPAEQFKLVFG